MMEQYIHKIINREMRKQIRFIVFAASTIPTSLDLWVFLVVLLTSFDKHIPALVWVLLGIEFLVSCIGGYRMRKSNDAD